ncbi:MAG: hypothetical protein AAF574_01340 [Pseudomonadota bacterium]
METDETAAGPHRDGTSQHLPKRLRITISSLFSHTMAMRDDAFFPAPGGALELGRSFITPEYQRSRHALDLLWRGIGSYLAAHPDISILYGTVSLSTQYDAVSTQMICSALIEADESCEAAACISAYLAARVAAFS